MFMSSSMKQPFILDRIIWRTWRFTRTRTSWRFRAYSISHRNWYCSILRKFWKCISLMEEISIVSWSSDRVDRSKSTCLLRFRSILRNMKGKQRCNYKMEGQVGDFTMSPLTKNWWASMRSNWIRVELFPRIFVIADSSRDPEWFATLEHRIGEVHRPDHLHVNVQRHRLDRERIRWNLYSEVKKSRNTRRDSRRDTGRFSVLETKTSGMELFVTHQKEKWDSAATQMVDRFKDTGHSVSKGISAVSRGLLKRRMAGTPYISMRMLRTPSSFSEPIIP